jgi:hypothetical protein
MRLVLVRDDGPAASDLLFRRALSSQPPFPSFVSQLRGTRPFRSAHPSFLQQPLSGRMPFFIDRKGSSYRSADSACAEDLVGAKDLDLPIFSEQFRPFSLS